MCVQEPCKSYDPNEQENTKNWLEIAAQLSKKADQKKNYNPLLDDPSIGWLKWAFILSFYFLLRYDTFIKNGNKKKVSNMYLDSVKQTIQLGGDTDTNACIVGGMIGALVGVNAIPTHMKQRLFCFDCTNPAASLYNVKID